jgi:CIC family chloride channel protein
MNARTLQFLLKPTRWRYVLRLVRRRLDDRLTLMLIGVVVGSFSGLAALALNRSIAATAAALHGAQAHGWFFLLPAAGAALSSLFLSRIARESAGHGVPEVIYSVSKGGGRLRLRSSFSRLVSSCLTIGTGGSAGPEAPVVMSGAAIGSNIATLLSLNERQRVTLVGCGAAAAISSIFNAPIAGIIFALEVILGEWQPVNIVPIAIAAVAGTEVSRLLRGNQIVFAHRVFDVDLLDTVACVGLAAFATVASILLTRALRGVHRTAKRVRAPAWARAALGGALVGLIGLAYPVVLGEGYHSVQAMIEGTFSAGLLVVAVGALAKIAATSLTIGSGGSGGIFAPCLLIGSFVGLLYHRFLATLWPDAGWVNEGCFALLGMAALISGIMQAPLTGIFLVVELTGGYAVILPLIVVSAISSTLCHYVEPASYYLRDLVEQGKLLRPGTDERVLSDLSVEELLERDCVAVAPHLPLREFVHILSGSRRNHFPVEDEKTGRFLGMIHLDDVRPYLFDPLMHDAVLVAEIMDSDVETVETSEDLAEVLARMDARRLFSMPVVENGLFRGMISKATILDKYRKELRVQTHH